MREYAEKACLSSGKWPKKKKIKTEDNKIVEILFASPILLKNKDSIIECSMKCFSKCKLTFGFDNIKIIKFIITRRGFFPSQRTCVK